MRSRSVEAIAVFWTLLWAGAAAAQAPPVPPEELPSGAEVLARGPVHEAFAEPVSLKAEAGLVVAHEPPRAIVEYPPAARPHGNSYVWVPGYWSWDADRDDFIWVSACWRIAPPGMRWVPGYWLRAAGGWEWVPGFWEPSGSRAIDYLPAPPSPVDLLPPGPPPGPSSVWVPGCWYWAQGRYVSRHGYWLAVQPGWVWVPSHYRWTPRGYVFVAGHWDYALQRRGVLFAPVYFPRSAYVRVGFSFSPSFAIDVGLLIGNLFACPRYGHYYFGDYYDDAYVRVGIYPQFEGERVGTWYDPIYESERVRHRKDDPRWEDRQRESYDRRRAQKDLRPPRTYRELETRAASLPEAERRSVEIVAPLRTVAARQSPAPTLEPIADPQRRQVSKKGAAVNTYRDKREKWEAPPAALPAAPAPPERATAPAPAREVPANRPERVKIPASPVAGKAATRSDTARNAPPPTPADERTGQAPSKRTAKPAGKGEPKDK